jgi:hypothetical protein
MTKAKTSITVLEACLQQPQPLNVELGDGKVLVSLTTTSGDVRFVRTTSVFVEAMRIANECLNANLGAILRDIKVF